jgi:hypothetical protein
VNVGKGVVRQRLLDRLLNNVGRLAHLTGPQVGDDSAILENFNDRETLLSCGSPYGWWSYRSANMHRCGDRNERCRIALSLHLALIGRSTTTSSRVVTSATCQAAGAATITESRTNPEPQAQAIPIVQAGVVLKSKKASEYATPRCFVDVALMRCGITNDALAAL